MQVIYEKTELWWVGKKLLWGISLGVNNFL